MTYLVNEEKTVPAVSTKVAHGDGVGPEYTAQEVGLYLGEKYWV